MSFLRHFDNCFYRCRSLRLFALLIDGFFIDDMCVVIFNFVFSVIRPVCWHLYIYIVKRRHPCFVRGATEILSIDWLIPDSTNDFVQMCLTLVSHCSLALYHWQLLQTAIPACCAAVGRIIVKTEDNTNPGSVALGMVTKVRLKLRMDDCSCLRGRFISTHINTSTPLTTRHTHRQLQHIHCEKHTNTYKTILRVIFHKVHKFFSWGGLLFLKHPVGLPMLANGPPRRSL